MLPRPKNYAIYPSVILADKPVEMTIVPCGRAFLLVEDEVYDLTVIGINSDEPYYYEPTARVHLTAVAHGGVLKFNYTFPGEQEHLIILSRGEKKLQEMNVYSLHEDLYGLKPLKGDLHTHSYRSDGKRDPAELAGHFREQGYDFFALTDHNRFYPGSEIDEVYAGVNLGLVRIRGEEVHAPGSVVHIIHVGGNTSVADLYVHNREGYEKEIAEYETRVPAHVPEKYHGRYARAMWVTDKIHEAGGLAIFPHPFWRPGKSQMYNVCEELAKLFLTSGMFDGYEMLGGMAQPDNNCSVMMWSELRAECGLRITVVGSSDIHILENADRFPHIYTICFAKDNSHDEIVAAVKAGRTVAVEDIGDESRRQQRCYGSLRLVMYAQYLLKHFFGEMERSCEGEGVAMRQYSMGAGSAELINLLADQSRDYRARFFGEKPPVLPDGDMLAFEEKWRSVHLKSPVTKGGLVYAEKVSRQI